MKYDQRRDLEAVDLRVLHDWFDHKTEPDKDNLSYPDLDTVSKNDYWTTALDAVTDQNESKIVEARAMLRVSDLPADCVNFWNSVFAAADHAPFEEFEKLLEHGVDMPEQLCPKCFAAAGTLIARVGMMEEYRRRKAERCEEEKRLHDLQDQAGHAQDRLSDAQNDLNNYRNS